MSATPCAVCVADVGAAGRRSAVSVLAAVPAGTRVFVHPSLGDLGDLGGAEPLEEETGHEALAIASAALGAAGTADVVVVAGGAEVAGGWLPALTAAAGVDTVVAGASAMREGDDPALQSDLALAATAESVGRWSAHVRPRIAGPHGPVVLLRRAAIQAAGPLPPARDLAAALQAWGERCAALGLGHVLADDVVVRGGNGPTALPDSPTVRRAIRASTRGLAPVSVTFDGRSLGSGRAGTQVHALELAAALIRTGRVSVRVVVPPDLGAEARALLLGADLLSYDTAARSQVPATDVVHRPSQVFSSDDLALLVPLGDRLVVTHQDLIAYRIAAYHATRDEWERYRSTTRLSLGTADEVVFFSDHARRDALADDLVDPAYASVIPIGVDHSTLRSPASARPAGVEASAAGHLLCLGADLRHKQRPFALRLLRALRACGWRGGLVLAGAHAEHGSSRDEEDALLSTDPELAAAVTRLGQVTEPERIWLTTNAAAVVYPSLYEGFGLMPFEAAAKGVPTLFAPQASLAEILAPGLAVLAPWDADASAAAALPLLTDATAREAHVGAIREAATALTWDRTAHALVDRYEALVAAPAREATAGPHARLELEQRLDASERIRHDEAARFNAFRAEIGSDALGLIGPQGLLTRRDQRALLAVASRAIPRRLLFAALDGLYRVAHRRS